ncbi:putative manganese-transporting ATPase PDR2, partial [Glycine soja]
MLRSRLSCPESNSGFHWFLELGSAVIAIALLDALPPLRHDTAMKTENNGGSSTHVRECITIICACSLFTLFMLFMFESTMAKSRLKTLTELRRVRVDSQILMVHRYGKWVKVSGTELLPEDVVSIGRSSGQNGEEKSVPADMLLLAGSVIVNEAILTGESTPQWKISIAGRGMEETLSARQDKNHVLFGGTKILQHTPDK